MFKQLMYPIRVTYLLGVCGVSVTYLYSYGISFSYAYQGACTCDVCVAYEAYS